MAQCEDTETLYTDHFSEELANLCIFHYCEGMYDEKLAVLDKLLDQPATLEEHCSQEFKPFIEGVYYSLKKLGFEYTKEEIYNGTARTKIRDNIELQDQLKKSKLYLSDKKEQNKPQKGQQKSIYAFLPDDKRKLAMAQSAFRNNKQQQLVSSKQNTRKKSQWQQLTQNPW